MGDSSWSRMPKRMSRQSYHAVADALSSLARSQKKPFSTVLHGGEPLLVGPADLEYVLSMLRAVLPSEYAISIQTNGILISSRILDICAAARTSLSISLDGPRHVHDVHRVGFHGEGTLDQVLEGIARLREHPESAFLFAGLLAVVDPRSDPREVYGFFKGLKPPSVDFIYQDGNHSRLPRGKTSVSSTENGRWMATLLDLYLADDSPFRIRILDDMIKLVLGGNGRKEGVGVTDYGILVIDTDGSVSKNDTLKSAFDGADRFSSEWSIHEYSLAEILSSTEFARYHSMQRPACSTCLSCPELQVCGGGMTLHRWRDDNGFDNPAVYCDDQRLLISHIRKKMHILGVA